MSSLSDEFNYSTLKADRIEKGESPVKHTQLAREGTACQSKCSLLKIDDFINHGFMYNRDHDSHSINPRL